MVREMHTGEIFAGNTESEKLRSGEYRNQRGQEGESWEPRPPRIM